MVSTNENPLIAEVAWEVCNQVGGIYTVIRTKAPSMQSRHGDNYFLVGPWNAISAQIEFEETEPAGSLAEAMQRYRATGARAFCGRWLIPGRPWVVLIDYPARYPSLGNDKYCLWKDQGITTANGDGEVDRAIAFGFCVAEFFRVLSDCLAGRPALAHFHEWQAGVAIPRMRMMNLPVATVFTTHATILGRYMASDNPNFYYDLNHTDPWATARHYNIEARYAFERSAAHGAHVFTTISDITAHESEKLLSRKPDQILPNGLNIDRYLALHEFQNLHKEYKERINQFVMGHFFPSYTFDLDRTLYVFTSGRYEYKNKGMDVFIEAMYRLNNELKESHNPPTVVAFIVTKTPVRSINVGVLQRQSMLEDLKNTCNELRTDLAKRLLSAASMGRIPGYDELITNDFQVRLKRLIHARKSTQLPSIVTHDLVDDANDQILRHLRHRRLFNAPSDPVKVIFHPDFLAATQPTFNLDYDHFVRGCHLGVFPSYYEPWGYTPLECIALGVPAITSDLTGFGNFAVQNIPNLSGQGMYVLRRAERNPDQAIEDLTTLLLRFCQLSRRDRIELRNRAERLSDLFNWSKLACYYHSAHEMAFASLHAARRT